MGVLFDSTVLIAAERAGKNPRSIIVDLAFDVPDARSAVSVLTVMELAHGLERANSAERRAGRERFLTQMLREIPIEPVTTGIAMRAGKIDGALKSRGVRVSVLDLLIGCTALELGYDVVTHNFRHFELIPGLQVQRI